MSIHDIFFSQHGDTVRSHVFCMAQSKTFDSWLAVDLTSFFVKGTFLAQARPMLSNSHNGWHPPETDRRDPIDSCRWDKVPRSPFLISRSVELGL